MRRLVLAALVAFAAAAPAHGMPSQEAGPPVPLPLPVPIPPVPPAPGPAITVPADAAPLVDPPIAWRSSRAVGKPYAGRLVSGVQLPEQGSDFWTYDWGLRDSPMRPWRRWGTARLVRLVLQVLAEHRAANPGTPRVGIADLSRRHGGSFGPNFGGKGHVSHQNGLDVDVLYPRVDGIERRAGRPAEVDRALAQDLVDRFVAAGATDVFVGPRLDLRGPRGVVAPLIGHDDHLHVRIR